jgi:hypothetical protein
VNPAHKSRREEFTLFCAALRSDFPSEPLPERLGRKIGLEQDGCRLKHHEWSQTHGQQKDRVFESGEAFGKGRNFCCGVDEEGAGKGGEPTGS